MNVLLAGTSGLDLLVKPMERAFADRDATVTVGPYGQWQRALIDVKDDSPVGSLVVVILDADDLATPYLDRGLGRVEGVASELVSEVLDTLARGVALREGCTFIVTTLALPRGSMLGPLADNVTPGLDAVLAEDMNCALRRWAAAEPRVHLLGIHRLFQDHGRARLRDPRLWAHARCRWSREGLELIANEIRSLFDAAHASPRKCLVLDLDNTLWGGILGEDGPSGIAIGHEGIGLSYREFQTCIQRLRSRGVLLAIASKNDEAAVFEVLDSHPGMVLHKDDFVAWRIDWNDKAASLVAIAEELRLGLDSMVFVDDNPVERERVERALPAVTVPPFPDDPTSLADHAQDVIARLFDRVDLVEEDANKTEQYHAERKRAESHGGVQTLDDFLVSLEMRASFVEPDGLTLPRFAQLLQKTNQFNVTTRRHDRAALDAMVAEPDRFIVLGVRLVDRFGDSGIVGLAIVERVNGDTWMVDSLLLSCRVIGRTLEGALLGEMAERVASHGGKELLARYIPTRKNVLVRGLFEELGFEHLHETEGHTEWRAHVSELRRKLETKHIRVEREESAR